MAGNTKVNDGSIAIINSLKVRVLDTQDALSEYKSFADQLVKLVNLNDRGPMTLNTLYTAIEERLDPKFLSDDKQIAKVAEYKSALEQNNAEKARTNAVGGKLDEHT